MRWTTTKPAGPSAPATPRRSIVSVTPRCWGDRPRQPPDASDEPRHGQRS